jgi:hypothetical protein
MCYLKRPKCKIYTKITLLDLTEDHWSLALSFPSDSISVSPKSPLLSQDGYDVVGGLEFFLNVT